MSESIFMASLGFVVCILITLVAGPMMRLCSLNQVQMMHHQQKKNQLHNSFNLAKFSILRQSLFYGFNQLVGVFCRRKEHSYEFWINDFDWNNWSALSHIGGIENATSASIEVRMRWRVMKDEENEEKMAESIPVEEASNEMLPLDQLKETVGCSVWR